MPASRNTALRIFRTAFAASGLLLCLCARLPAAGALNELLSWLELPASELPAPPLPKAVYYLTDYSYVDPQGLIPAPALAAALNYYRANVGALGNPRYLSVIDYTRHANEKRFFVADMKTGLVETFLVAHGRGSDPLHTGYAGLFSNEEGSHATSLGLFLTGKTYNGENGYSLILYGLSDSNSNAFARFIVVHGAPYVSPANVPLGRSWGCPAVEMGVRTRLINLLKGGSLIYAWHARAPAY